MIESAEEFKRLRESEDVAEYTRAGQQEAAASVWLEVIDRYPEMREWVAYNKTVPLAILEVLSRDTDPKVRYRVARKRKLDWKLFDFLSRDDDESVRCAVGLNRRAPSDVLRRLANDKSSWVREQLKDRISGLPG